MGFSWHLKALMSAAFLKENGSSFQSLGPAMENALSLYATILDLGTLKSSWEEDLSECLWQWGAETSPHPAN